MAPPAPSEPAVLAVDGGASKTDLLLVSAAGAVLGQARVGASNHQLVGLDGALEALTEGVAAVRADAGLGAGSPVCPVGVYCLAGIDLPVDEEKLTPAIEAHGWTARVILRNDTFAVARAGTTGTWGIGVVCGTGMNCAATGPDGRTVRFPALAELSGDFAPGGSWLGLRALGLALRAGDGRGAPTTLADLVPAHFGAADPEAVLTGIYTGSIPYAGLFDLARVLLDAAAAGDPEARAAADTLADEVVAFVRAAVARLDVADEVVEVVLGGGIFETADQTFHARVTSGIREAAPKAALVRLDVPPVLGAALLGLDDIGAPSPAQFAVREALATSTANETTSG
ncbi:MAG TPA: BadF/BadG/BcrA/BcrD ATPase family protein [Acidimicrobiales bacterium]|nr:BadF/BadG/BcrA/BcrD ATPase family protein [Acidimicrobiales bacterium]